MGETVPTADGETLQRSEEPVNRPLRTVFGLHAIRAYVYSPGPHEKILLRPIDARLELPAGRASYLMEEFSQYFCVEQAFRPSSQGLETVLRQKLSVDTLERINQRMGAQAKLFFNNLPVPDPEKEGELLVFTGDGKGVPLVKKDAERATAMEKPERPGNRKMATLAGVYSVDRHVRSPEAVVAALFRDGERGEGHRSRPGPKFKHIRGCFPKAYEDADETTVVSGPLEAFTWAEQQVVARLQPGQPLVRLMDGQVSLWDAADVCLESAPAEGTIDILDILHVSHYVWRAAKVFHKTMEHREAFARERLLRILRGEIRSVIRGFRQMASQRRLSAERRKEIRTVCGYLEGNVTRMRYDEYLREGYPIATGVIVTGRFKQGH